MSKSQRDKGKRGELEVVHILNDYGFPARRGDCFRHEDDVMCEMLPFHFEVKRQETIKLNDWWRQSESACGEDEIPTVVFRQNNQDWKLVIRLTDFLELVKEAMH